MRLTDCLHRQNLHRWFTHYYKKRLRYRDYPAPMPEDLSKKGFNIVEYGKEKLTPPGTWRPPVADCPVFLSRYPEFRIAKEPQDDPNWHPEECYLYTPTTHLLNGIDQALVLTKTKRIDGMPDSVSNKLGAYTLPNTDYNVQRTIMLANIWHPSVDKLPRRPDPHYVWQWPPPQYEKHNPNAEFGNTKREITHLMSLNFIRFCESVAAKELGSLRHQLTRDVTSNIKFAYKGSTDIVLETHSDWVMSLPRNTLEPFADARTVENTRMHQLQDFTPISELIDFTVEHIYKTDFIDGINPSERLLAGMDTAHQHAGLLWLTDNCREGLEYDDQGKEKDPREDSNNLARALFTTFSHAMIQARRLYGADIFSPGFTLPRPICIHAVHSNVADFDFLYFQLNTTDFATDSGLKNVCYMTPARRLYRKHIPPKDKMLIHTEFSSYNASVFEQLMATFMNCALAPA